jgi:serine/threonine protein phosphatase PrpC
MVLLASDGLTRYVSEDEIGEVLGSGRSAAALCSKLNITCLILRITVAAPA